MKPEQLGKMAELLGGMLEPDEASRVYASGVSVDSRQLNPGELFFALAGERDGHDFLMDAYTKGAIGAVVQRPAEIAIPQIVVKDTLMALGNLAAAYRKAIAPRVIAITGSVGKTTAREMIAAALRTKFQTHSAKHNYNNLIGLPMTILDMQPGTEFAIVEFGINQQGEMERLVEIAHPDAALITAIAPVHTEGLGGMENILAEKLKIAHGLSHDAPLFLNVDSQPLEEARQTAHDRTITYGIASDADFRAENVQLCDGRASFVVRDVQFELHLLGRAPIYAALAAIAVADSFGISPVTVAEILRNESPQPHRMELRRAGKITILDDSYNSSPVALQEALETMAQLNAQRRIAILGDMLELGKFEEQYHREAGQLILQHALDGVVLFGTLMNYAFDEAKKLDFAGELFWSDDYLTALDAAQKMIQANDMVLVKGSHSMQMEQFVDEISDMFGKESDDEY